MRKRTYQIIKRDIWAFRKKFSGPRNIYFNKLTVPERNGTIGYPSGSISLISLHALMTWRGTILPLTLPLTVYYLPSVFACEWVCVCVFVCLFESDIDSVKPELAMCITLSFHSPVFVLLCTCCTECDSSVTRCQRATHRKNPSSIKEIYLRLNLFTNV